MAAAAYAACLEAMGLNPVMVMMKGHIFVGVWLAEESFSDMIMDDPSPLEKRMSKGIHEMVLEQKQILVAMGHFVAQNPVPAAADVKAGSEKGFGTNE